MNDAQSWIDHLGMEKHPEGGYYKETYRSAETIPASALPRRFSSSRVFATSIYFLLTSNEFSALHRIRQDEVWYFHAGSPVTLHVIDEKGLYTMYHVGSETASGVEPQAVLKAGCLFGATIDRPDSYGLVGCSVAPGFEFADFEMPTRKELVALFPQHASLIERLTR